MRILIAEDEVEIARALKVLLEKNKCSVDIVHNGKDAWDYISQGKFDVVVLDIMMPEMDGLEVLRKMRDSHDTTPVMLLTAKSEIEDRVKALGRRSLSYTESLIRVGDTTLDCNRFELSAGDVSVRLNNKEYQLMELFMKHPRFVFSTEHIMEKIWGQDAEAGMDVVWTYIGFLRKKLKQLGASVEIKTVRGAGYSLEETTC